jgi:hypothetical protein
MYRLLSILLFFSQGLLCPAMASQAAKIDSSQLQVRSFDKQHLQKYSSQKEFTYGDGTLLEQDLWSRFWSWLWSLFDELLGDSGAGSLMKFVVILLVIAFAVYGIVKFSGVDFRFLTSRSKALDVPYTETIDNIHEIDFGSQIEAAIARGNFRLAVRLYYLRTLKVLSDRSLISWQPEKTNSTYVNEIADLPVRQQFAHLTRNFEYVWYGEFDLNRDNFDVLKERFDQFNQGT